jgi:voltage-gated potassium channel
MPEMPNAPAEPSATNGGPSTARTITVDLDRKLDERLGLIARWKKTTQEELLARIVEDYPRRAEQRRLTVQVNERAAARLAAAAATIGMSEEELIAEAIDNYSPPESKARSWPTLFWLGLLVLPPVLMFASPQFATSGSAMAWIVFALVMLACCAGAAVLVTAVVYAEWVVIKYGVIGLIVAAACGMSGVLSMFADAYWSLASLIPASFNLPMSRVDAVYFTLGTFTTTGTGRFSPQTPGAELLVCSQVVLGWGFVAVLVALLVPRAAAAYKRQSNGRIIVHTGQLPADDPR